MNKISLIIISIVISSNVYGTSTNYGGGLKAKTCYTTITIANQNIKKGYYELNNNNDNNARIYLAKAREGLGVIIRGCRFVMDPNGYRNKEIDYKNVEIKLREIIERQEVKRKEALLPK